MTKTIPILGLSFAAIFVVAMISPAVASDDGFLTVVGGGVDDSKKNTYLAFIDGETDIPKHTDAIGGYGWFTGGSDWAVYAITTHNVGDVDESTKGPNNDVRDSKQNPDGWHAHLVNVDGNACITEVTDDTTAGISINDGNMSVHITKKKIDGAISGTAAGFHIVPGVADCVGVHPLALQVQFT